MTTKEIMHALSVLQMKFGSEFKLPYSHPLMTEFDRIRDLISICEFGVKPDIDTLLAKSRTVEPKLSLDALMERCQSGQYTKNVEKSDVDDVLEAIRVHRNKR